MILWTGPDFILKWQCCYSFFGGDCNETATRLQMREMTIVTIMWFALEGIDQFTVVGNRTNPQVIYLYTT